MNDPFDVLRRPPEPMPARSLLDNGFRAALLESARARIEGSERRRTDLEPPPITVEPIAVPGTTQSTERRRPLALAAASVALVSAGVASIVILSGGGDDPAPTDTGRTGAVETTAPSTPPPASSTTETADIDTADIDTADHPIIGPAEPDDAIAMATLIDDRYVPEAFDPAPAVVGWTTRFDARAASDVDACADFLPAIVSMDSAQSATASRAYSARRGDGTLVVHEQFVAVFVSEAVAASAFDAITNPAFAPCARELGTGRDGVPDALTIATATDPPFDPPDVDQFEYRTWSDGGSQRAGAIVRMGRMIGYVDAPGPSGGAPIDVPPASFAGLVTAMLDEYTRGEAEVAAAESVLLAADEYGDGWASTPPTQNLSAEFVPQYALDIPECSGFEESVFQTMYELPHALAAYYRPYPEAAMGQYVVAFPDDAAATAMMDTLHSAEFAPCATAYQAYVLGSNCCNGGPALPAAFDRPATDPPFEPVGDDLVYRLVLGSWTGPSGEVHGPELVFDASIRVGRIVSFISTLGEGDGADEGGRDVVVTTDEQFAAMLGHVERRARDALAQLDAPSAPEASRSGA